MRNPVLFKFSIAVLIQTLIIIIAPANLRAQSEALPGSLEPDPGQAVEITSEFRNTLPSGLAHLIALEIKTSVLKSPCPDEAMEISVSYLAGTGNPALDALLREDALGRVAAAEAEAAWFYADRPQDQPCLADLPAEETVELTPPGDNYEEEPTPGLQGDVALSYHKRVLEVSQPSPGKISILYTIIRDYFLVNNPGFDYWSASYDVAEARLLALDDLFPDRALGLPKFWNAAARGFCAAAQGPSPSLPSFYGYRGPCPEPGAEEELPLPEALSSPDATLPDLGFPLFTPEGLTLHLNPYQGWGVAMGPISINIGLTELKDMGASMSIWGQ